jgi:hypothetical protein
LGGDAPFDDDDMNIDEGGDPEEPESPRSPSKQPQTPRRIGTSNVLEPPPRSKNKTSARKENQDGGDAEEEIAQGLQEVEMQQEDEDEDEEVTPTKKPAKRPRKKRVLAEIPRKKLSANVTTFMLISFQYLRKIHLGSEEANDYVTSHLNGGGARKLCMEGVIQARKLMFQQSKRLFVSRKRNPSRWVLLRTRSNAARPIAEKQLRNEQQ